MIEAHPLLATQARKLAGDGRAALERVLESARADGASTASGAPDAGEAIHDLRVALRRLRSVLRPMRVVYGKKSLVGTEERLRAILDSTSDLRDEEVLRETLADLGVDDATRSALARWMTGRARRERGLRGRAVRALGGEADHEAETSVRRCLTTLETRLDAGPKRAIGVDGFRRAALARALEDLEERVEAARVEDGLSMHRVRIGAKRVRYVAELLGATEEQARGAAIAGPRGATGAERTEVEALVELGKIEKAATKIQKRLGTLHDLDEALARMGRAWGLDEAPRKKVLEALRRARAKTAEKSESELRDELRRIRSAAAALLDERRTGLGGLATTRPAGRDEDAAS